MNFSGIHSAILIDSGGGWFSSESDSPVFVSYSEPEVSFSSFGHQITVVSKNSTEQIEADPLSLLDDFLSKGYTAIGYIGYEYSRYTMDGYMPKHDREDHKYPDVNFLLYKQNHDIRNGAIEDLQNDLQLTEIKQNTNSNSTSELPPHLCPNMTKYQYIDMINKAKSYIQSGDIYQVNLSQKMVAQLKLGPLEHFLKFYSVQPVPFGCYLDFGDFQLLSGSMELFLKKTGNKLTTNPIKGTIKRGITDEKDTILKAKLVSSEKERAENLMIVDLMRNDLGTVSKAGTVKVNKLFDIETYSTLHQMVSEIESEVSDNIKSSQIVRSVFPPGSVTGAPKKRTLEVIDELEPHLRGPYCGTIGIFYPNGDFTLSVAIRVSVREQTKAIYYAGGGIVWDSDPEKEYDEVFLKLKAASRAMGIDSL